MKYLYYFSLAVFFCLGVWLWSRLSGSSEYSFTATSSPVSIQAPDPRADNLRGFFTKHNCPSLNDDLINDYITSAEKYHIPYALLPAVSVVESSCGRHYRYQNFWGWNSAQTGFDSLAQGIDFISSQLANGRYYSGKTLIQKLSTYNSVNPAYADEVIKLMQEIDPNSYAP